MLFKFSPKCEICGKRARAYFGHPGNGAWLCGKHIRRIARRARKWITREGDFWYRAGLAIEVFRYLEKGGRDD